MKWLLLSMFFLSTSCSSIFYKEKEVIATYSNGYVLYVLNTEKEVIATYSNGYVLNTEKEVIATYSNGYVLNTKKER